MLGTLVNPDEDVLYGIFYTLHLLSVIAGLGPTFVYPMFSAMARKRPGAEGFAINQTTLRISERMEYAIYLIPIFGIILILLSDGASEIEFSDAWISIAFALYFLALAVSLGLHLPNLRRMEALQAELISAGPPPAGGQGGPPPQVAELEQRGKRAGMYGGLLHLLLLLILLDMVWKPGV